MPPRSADPVTIVHNVTVVGGGHLGTGRYLIESEEIDGISVFTLSRRDRGLCRFLGYPVNLPQPMAGKDQWLDHLIAVRDREVDRLIAEAGPKDMPHSAARGVVGVRVQLASGVRRGMGRRLRRATTGDGDDARILPCHRTRCPTSRMW